MLVIRFDPIRCFVILISFVKGMKSPTQSVTTITLRAMSPHQITQQFEGWASEFGGDYELDIFGVRMVVVTGLADIRSILMLRPSAFKRDMSSVRD